MVRLFMLAEITLLFDGGGSMLKIPKLDIVELENSPFKTIRPNAEKSEVVTLLNPLEALSDPLATNVDTEALDRLLY